MHPEIRQDKPGRCPECGMNLIPSPQPSPARLPARQARGEGGDAGHDKHEGHSLKMFLSKFWISLILTIPVVLYSELPQRLLNWQAPEFAGSQYLSLLFGSIVFFYGGWVFLQGAWRELRARLPGMMTLIGIAITAAYVFSIFETLRGSPHTLFWELTTLITIMLLGHYLEMRAVQGAQGALKELAKLLPDEVEVIIAPHLTSPTRGEEKDRSFPPPGGEGLREGGRIQIIPISELKVNDLVLVRPGGRVPADGEIIEGNSEVNESLITGESRPVEKNMGDKVIAGTINGDGSLKIKTAQIGEKTFLAGVMQLVAEAQASKSRLQVLSDRAAFYLTIIALVTGAITFISWLIAGKGGITATERLVAVLVVACPHALGLAVPLVASISTTMAARRGFLVKQRLALEAARNIDIVLFDKTGTLTKGEFGVDKVTRNLTLPSLISEREILQLAASVNQHSEHPIGKALLKETKNQKIELLESKDFQRIPGKGAKAVINGEEVVVGSEAILPPHLTSPTRGEEKDGSFPPPGGEGLKEGGKTIIHVVKDDTWLGSIALVDVIREESREAIQSLKQLGLKTAMVTGDSEDVAAWVAKELEIDEYYARVLPEDKVNIVKKLQASTSLQLSPSPGERASLPRRWGGKGRGRIVGMVGDGVNDAPALTQADLGIAIGAGTNVAIESAGIILVKNDPRDIVRIIRLSQLTYRKMIQNLFWATGYNAVALPLAAGVLAAKGIILQPALAALFMSLSTVVVAINAVLLRKQRI